MILNVLEYRSTKEISLNKVTKVIIKYYIKNLMEKWRKKKCQIKSKEM